MRVCRDEWLTDVMGRPAFRVDIESASSVTDLSVLENAAGSLRSFYYAKVPVDRVDLVRCLTAYGFYAVDVNVTFGRVAQGATAGARSESVLVRPAEEGDAEPVLDIAGTAFRYSRFHLDPAIEPAVANRIKREWIANYLNDRRGLRLFVAVVGTRIAGFLAALGADREGKRIRLIDLIAVSTRDRQCGVGRELVSRFVDEFAPQADLLEVGTQIANTPSIRLYERSGFSIVRSAYVLHKHLPADAF